MGIYCAEGGTSRQTISGKKVILSVPTRDGEEHATQFSIWRCMELEPEDRLLMLAYEEAYMVVPEDWDDEKFARYEKQAALAAGVQPGESFLVSFTRI